jgi:hypothetical protein
MREAARLAPVTLFPSCLSSVLADGAIYAAMLFISYPDVTRVIGPLNGVFKALALIGKALRFKL